MYLVDTNVISAAAPSRPVSPALIEWMDAHSASLFLSVVTVAEIEDGIAKARREGAAGNGADRRRDLGSGARLRPDTGTCRHHHRRYSTASRADRSVP